MKTEELYAEVPCRRCGKSKLRSSSFCPHCGHVQEETWFDRLRNRLGGAGGEGAGTRNSLAIVIASVVLAGAAFLAVDAISEGRYTDLITIGVMVLLSIRAFMRMRNKSASPGEATTEASTDRTVSRAQTDDLAPQYSCENCGTRVDVDAAECPKCGTRFA